MADRFEAISETMPVNSPSLQNRPAIPSRVNSALPAALDFQRM
jgi:hypothetical protein